MVRPDNRQSVVTERRATRVVVGGQGPAGRHGATLGIPYSFSTATADADPGAGYLRLNAAPASATAAYIDNVARGGGNVANWLDTIDDGGSAPDRGTLRIVDENDPAVFAMFRVSGSVVDGSGYRKLTLAHQASQGAFVNGASVQLLFQATGVPGSATSSSDTAWSGDITPGALTAEVDNYNPTGWSAATVIRQDQDAERAVNGLAGGADGRLAVIANTSSKVLRLNAERASSSAANRIAGAQDVSVDPGFSALAQYDATSSRWRPVAPRLKPLHKELYVPAPSIIPRPTEVADWRNFPWLDPYWAFANGSLNRTYLDEKGILRYAPGGVPRFHTDYATGERGYLNEGQRTNLLLRSSEFDHASWNKVDSTVTANAAIAPDGTMTADKLVESAALGIHRVAQSAGPKTATALPFSITAYAKAAGRSQVHLVFLDGAGGFAQFVFDLINGTIPFGPINVGFTSVSAKIERLPLNWFRCHMTATTTATTGIISSIYTGDGTSNANYVGDGTSGIYLWGAQTEQANFASSYIPTAVTQVTRNGDFLRRLLIDGLNNETEGTVSFRMVPLGITGPTGVTSPFLLYESANIGANAIQIREGAQLGGSGGPDLFVRSGGATQVDTLSLPMTAGLPTRVAAGWRLDDFAIAADGATPLSDNSGLMPINIDTLALGFGGTNALYTDFTYWRRRLSNADLQAITS